ncbi:uncharacterized protein EV420DRAFT_1481416 [Desarmillaria tabescens]|uniref:Uncharacterized protein n=1 Tax=Armillaria tabescens TaxID=1929756 RepID=A0AA39K5X9_ARMTA|nr:uncharacterized protein EV420DRAFT_1481416 [Desarmillaria tabescens]KAK0455159.1 hypothetical protein EV420DRAFT_1481416 [Desarmillaria tabescens]
MSLYDGDHMNPEDHEAHYSVVTLESTLLLYAYELERTQQRAPTLPNSAQAHRSPPSQRTTTSSHSKTWKGKMTAGAKKLGLPFGKKTPADTVSLQTTTETVPESSYMYEKPEGSTLMSLEEESSPTEAMKYASQVQHQEQLKESGYDQMPGAMWEATAMAQIVQTMEAPGQQMSTVSSPGESPSWQEAARQWKASQGIRRGIPQSQESKALGPRPAPPAGYPGTQQTGLDESTESTLHDVIRCRSLAQIDTFQTLQSNLTPESSNNGQKRNTSEPGQMPSGNPQLHESHQLSPHPPSGEPSTRSPRKKTLSLSHFPDPQGPRPPTILMTKTHGESRQIQRSSSNTPMLTPRHGSEGSYLQTPMMRTRSSGGSQEPNPLPELPTQASQIGLTAGAGSADDYGTWPKPDITKLGPTQSSNPSLPPNQPSTLNPPSYPRESYSGGSMTGQTSETSSKVIEDTSHMSGTGTRYGSTEIPTSYDMNPFSTQPTISTDWTHGLEPGYKSTGSPMRENTKTIPPSTKGTTSSFKGPAPIPTDEELYRMNWDQFWWYMHAKLPYETYWSTSPQG